MSVEFYCHHTAPVREGKELNQRRLYVYVGLLGDELPVRALKTGRWISLLPMKLVVVFWDQVHPTDAGMLGA